MKRVLFVHYGENWIRGSERALLDLLERLDRERFLPRLLCNQPLLAERVARTTGIETAVLPIPEIMVDERYLRLEILPWLRTIGRLRGEIARHGADLLYANSGLPCQAGWYAARSSRIPLLAHLHCPYSWRYLHLYRLTNASHVIFGSEILRQEAQRCARFSGASTVVPYGIDTERFRPVIRRPEPRAALGIRPDRVVIGQVASLIRRKGGDVLIDAFARLSRRRPESHLVLVGAGPEDGALRALAGRLEVADRVVFAGAVDGADVFYQHVFDVHVVASRSEGLPLAALEAGACGLPQVGTALAGIPDVIVEGHSGLLTPSDDAVALEHALDRLVADAGLRRKLGMNASNLVRERFSMAAYVRGIEDTMQQILQPI